MADFKQMVWAMLCVCVCVPGFIYMIQFRESVFVSVCVCVCVIYFISEIPAHARCLYKLLSQSSSALHPPCVQFINFLFIDFICVCVCVCDPSGPVLL